MSKTVIGVDIGNSEVKFAVNKKGAVRYAAAQLPENLVSSGRIILPESTAAYIKDAKKKNRVPGAQCALVLPDNQVFFRRLSLPYMTVDQLELNLPYEFRDYIPDSSDNYFFDYAVEGLEIGDEGKPTVLKLIASAAPKALIKEYVDLFKLTGLKLRYAIPRELCYRAIILDYEKRKNTPGETAEYCITDIGQNTTRLYIFRSGMLLASRSVDLGCADIDVAIAELHNVDTFVASSYKAANYKNVLDSEKVADAYHRISIEILKAINFYRYDNIESSLNDIYFTGGGGEINQLTQAIAQAAQLAHHGIGDLMPESALSEKYFQGAVAYGATLHREEKK